MKGEGVKSTAWFNYSVQAMNQGYPQIVFVICGGFPSNSAVIPMEKRGLF